MKRIDRMIVAAAVCLAGAALAGRVVAAEQSEQTDANAPASSSLAGPQDAPTTGAAPNETAPSGTATSANGQKDAQSVIALWPDKTKTAAQALVDKYGTPDVVTDKMVGWNERDQWMMVGVYRDAVSVKEPTAHDAFIVNKISYKVPENKVGSLARFDHALVVDQIRGTLAVQGDSEQHNVLALNLANEIVTGKRDVASARSFMKKTLMESMAGKSSPYVDSLKFTPAPSDEPASAPASAMPGQNTEGAPQTPPMP
jgi:hypothetical protein